MFITKYSNRPNMQLMLVWLINDNLALQEALNSEASYIDVLAVPQIKTLWLVTVPKNVVNFSLIYQ